MLRLPEMASIYQHFTGNPIESSGYIGLPLIALVLVIVICLIRNRLVLWGFLTGVALVVLSLGPSLHIEGTLKGIPLPWALLQTVPSLDSVLPGRITIVAFLCVSCIMAAGVDALPKVRSQSGRAAAVVGIGLVLISLVPNSMATMTPVIPKFFISRGVQTIRQGSVALVLPARASDTIMLWQAESGIRFRTLTGRVLLPSPNGRGTPGCARTNSCRATRAPDNPLLRRITSLTNPRFRYSRSFARQVESQLRTYGVQRVIAGPGYSRTRMGEILGRDSWKGVNKGDVYVWIRQK